MKAGIQMDDGIWENTIEDSPYVRFIRTTSYQSGNAMKNREDKGKGKRLEIATRRRKHKRAQNYSQN